MGKGRLRFSLIFPALLGINLKSLGVGDLNAFGFFLDAIIPFIIIIIVSYMTGRNHQEALDQFYGRMHTPVCGSPADDANEMTLTRKNPLRFKHKKSFPNSNIELLKPTRRDLLGFLAISGVVVIVILFLYVLTRIGN